MVNRVYLKILIIIRVVKNVRNVRNVNGCFSVLLIFNHKVDNCIYESHKHSYKLMRKVKMIYSREILQYKI